MAEEVSNDSGVRMTKGRPLRVPGWSYPVGTVLLAVIAWQLFVVVFRIPRYLLPSPYEVVKEIIARWDLLFIRHAVPTIKEIILGFLMSVAVGIPLAVMIVYSPVLNRSIYPLLVASQTVPKSAIAPLFVVWFGFGLLPKVLVAFLISFFPIVIDTVVGLKSISLEMIQMARSMGASPLQMFLKIRFPCALPNIFGGLKVGITLAVVGAIVGEFIGADRGLGYVLIIANGNLDTELLFAGLTVLTLIGVTFFVAIDVLERLLIPWHVSRRVEATGITM